MNDAASGRVYVRIGARISVAVRPEPHFATIWFLTRDLSVGGVFLESDLLFDPGTPMILRFRVAADPDTPEEEGVEHEVRGRVVWARDEEQSPDEVAGMGVAFEEMPHATRHALAAYIAMRVGQFRYDR